MKTKWMTSSAPVEGALPDFGPPAASLCFAQDEDAARNSASYGNPDPRSSGRRGVLASGGTIDPDDDDEPAYDLAENVDDGDEEEETETLPAVRSRDEPLTHAEIEELLGFNGAPQKSRRQQPVESEEETEESVPARGRTPRRDAPEARAPERPPARAPTRAPVRSPVDSRVDKLLEVVEKLTTTDASQEKPQKGPFTQSLSSEFLAAVDSDDPVVRGNAISALYLSAMNNAVMFMEARLQQEIIPALLVKVQADFVATLENRSKGENFYTKFAALNNPLGRQAADMVSRALQARARDEGHEVDPADPAFLDLVGSETIKYLQTQFPGWNGGASEQPRVDKKASSKVDSREDRGGTQAPQRRRAPYVPRTGSRPPAGPGSSDKSAEIRGVINAG